MNHSAIVSQMADIEHSSRMEAMGRLSAGVAHEINTPMQYIGDSLRYLSKSFERLEPVLDLLPEIFSILESPDLADRVLSAELQDLISSIDLRKIRSASTSIPEAIEDSLTGVSAVGSIVHAMKQFSHPGSDRRMGLNIHEIITTAATLAKNEYKYTAELELNFAPDLPLIEGFAARLSQAFLSLIVNAAQAIGEIVAGTDTKGLIKISTRLVDQSIEVVVSDTGGGIPPENASSIFKPFFTTKEPGCGTGQGLAFVHSTIVDQHSGTITLNNHFGQGVEFIIRLPIGHE
jgi:signal transduction histidine kinase